MSQFTISISHNFSVAHQWSHLVSLRVKTHQLSSSIGKPSTRLDERSMERARILERYKYYTYNFLPRRSGVFLRDSHSGNKVNTHDIRDHFSQFPESFAVLHVVR
jgi:hypothetical protein